MNTLKFFIRTFLFLIKYDLENVKSFGFSFSLLTWHFYPFFWISCTDECRYCTKPSLLHEHCHLTGHSVADMKVQILEKIYHSSENPVNIRLHRRIRELHRIKEFGTAAPYGCNDQIKGVGTLSSSSCKHTNVLGVFSKQQQRKRSHGHRHYNRKSSARFKHRYFCQSH